VSAPRSSLVELLHRFRRQLRSERIVRFSVPAADQRLALERVWSLGGEIVSVNPVRRSLEEVFLEVTRDPRPCRARKAFSEAHHGSWTSHKKFRRIRPALLSRTKIQSDQAGWASLNAFRARQVVIARNFQKYFFQRAAHRIHADDLSAKAPKTRSSAKTLNRPPGPRTSRFRSERSCRRKRWQQFHER